MSAAAHFTPHVSNPLQGNAWQAHLTCLDSKTGAKPGLAKACCHPCMVCYINQVPGPQQLPLGGVRLAKSSGLLQTSNCQNSAGAAAWLVMSFLRIRPPAPMQHPASSSPRTSFNHCTASPTIVVHHRWDQSAHLHGGSVLSGSACPKQQCFGGPTGATPAPA